MREYKGPRFAAVWAAVSNGEKLLNAVKAQGVSIEGYRVWCARHNFPHLGVRAVPGNAALKAAEREIRAGKIFYIARKHGLDVQAIYHRKKCEGDEGERMALALAEIAAAPPIGAICAKHGITIRQLYTWRHATGGLPVPPLLCESAS